MKKYIIRVVGNDGFDRAHDVDAVSIKEAAETLPHVLEALGRTTIEQFVRVEIFLPEKEVS